MKYAVVERERRFLPRLPVDLSRASRAIQIEDRYLIGTRLRLRTVREPGRAAVRKLGQKRRLAAGGPSELAHTTVYLDDAEHALLSGLPAFTLIKTRHVVPMAAGLDAAVDVFHGRLSGLTTAEVDLGVDRSLPEPFPEWIGVEVTDVEELTGYALAALAAGEVGRLLATYGG